MENETTHRIPTSVRETHNGVVLRLWPGKEDAEVVAKLIGGEPVLHVSQNGWFLRDVKGGYQDAAGELKQDPNQPAPSLSRYPRPL